VTRDKVTCNDQEEIVKSHKDLDAYKESMKFVTHIYQLTQNFPKGEIYGLTNQIRRAAVSIPSNLSEGAARQSNKEFIQFLYVSLGSLAELETQLEIAYNINYLPAGEHEQIQNEITKIRSIVIGLIRHLKEKDKQ